MTEYVRNKKNRNVIKPVECAADYIATGEWELCDKPVKEKNIDVNAKA